MTKKHHNLNPQHHEAAPSARPVLNEQVEEKMTTKQREENDKSARHNYSKEDKRETAQIEHTNGSTPRRDQ